MSRKRKRDASDIDVDLVKIYDQLAHENEAERLKAAHQLISKVFGEDSVGTESITTILKRLFRGLCSNRKAARHGFAIALTEILSQITVAKTANADAGITISKIIDILDKQTSIDGHGSGQDERDHYFGRLFGADAIVKSGVIFKADDHVQWKRLLDFVCDISMKKPWLRRECGWILLASVTIFPDQSFETYAVEIVEGLTSHKLIRSPEGVAIWIAITERFPGAKLPQHVWKYGHPLAVKDAKGLAEVLKDAKGQPEADKDNFEAQGAASWSTDLHFVWDIVLSKLLKVDPSASKNHKDLLRFEDFWTIIVSDNLFKENSSIERKHWGFLLLAQTLHTAPVAVVKHVFTKDTVHCLVTALAGENSYYRKTARRVVQTITKRAEDLLESSESVSFASECLTALIQAVDFGDFDQLTKTKTIEELVQKSDTTTHWSLFLALVKLFEYVIEQDQQQMPRRCRHILNLQLKIFSASLKHVGDPGKDKYSKHDPSLRVSSLSRMLGQWIFWAYNSPHTSETVRTQVREKLASAFEQSLRLGGTGRVLMRAAIEDLSNGPYLNFDKRLSKQITKSHKVLTELPQDSSLSKTDIVDGYGDEKEVIRNEPKKVPTTFTDGLALLYCLVIFEVYNGETEAVEILEELLHDHGDSSQTLSAKGKSNTTGATDPTDLLIETLLSFAARPSKFMRRATVQIFETLASQVTSTGLQSLARVLGTKENSQGQLDMFEAGDIGNSNAEDEDQSNDDSSNSFISNADSSEAASDVEMLDSDVEVESAGDGTSDDDTDTTSSSGEGENDENDENEDDELARFDAALAAALGTQRNETDLQAGHSSDSDEDMDDDQMMALDEKLTEVFRARKAATSKKKDRKDAKENIVNFKNRALDMIEAYLKLQYLSPLSPEFIVPLLLTTRTTQTKQIAERCCNILRDYCGRCKGQNVPSFDSQDVNSKQVLLDLLANIHGEACIESSNAHSAAASQSSILVSKIILHANVPVGAVIKQYSNTRLLQLTDASCKVQPSFFTDWNNWCTSARAHLVKTSKPVNGA